jgi:MFS family permease
VEPLATPNDAARGEIGGATRATYAAFAASGFAFASWASRIPQVKHRLGLDQSALGLTLLAIAAGSVIALPLSGPVVGRFGSRRTVATIDGHHADPALGTLAFATFLAAMTTGALADVIAGAVRPLHEAIT